MKMLIRDFTLLAICCLIPQLPMSLGADLTVTKSIERVTEEIIDTVENCLDNLDYSWFKTVNLNSDDEKVAIQLNATVVFIKMKSNSTNTVTTDKNTITANFDDNNWEITLNGDYNINDKVKSLSLVGKLSAIYQLNKSWISKTFDVIDVKMKPISTLELKYDSYKLITVSPDKEEAKAYLNDFCSQLLTNKNFTSYMSYSLKFLYWYQITINQETLDISFNYPNGKFSFDLNYLKIPSVDSNNNFNFEYNVAQYPVSTTIQHRSIYISYQ